MKPRTSIFPLLFIFFITSALCSTAQEIDPSPVKLKITGDVDPNSQTTSLWVLRQNDNPKNPTAEIPIIDGKIDFIFETSEPDRFSLISKQDLFQRGMCMPMGFLTEDGEITLTGKDLEDDTQCLKLKLESASSPLNKRLIEYSQYRQRTYYPKLDSISTLSEALSEEEYYSAEGKAFMEELNALMEKISEYPDSLPLLEQRNTMYESMDRMRTERRINSERYYELLDQMLEINQQMIDYEIETFGTPDGDLFCLSILSDDFFNTYDNDSIKARIIDVYLKNFKDRFSNNLMGKRMNEAIVGYEVKHIGGRYPDYQLPDAQGNLHNIKDLINGRIVLIDLWGSTCGPCMINSRLMIPVYEGFKDKGFDIIGIAREYKDLNGFFSAVKKNGYPWIQLIEMDDAYGIFNLHGIPNAMGGTYLVGPTENDPTDIRILLINPTAEELREFLSEYYSTKD